MNGVSVGAVYGARAAYDIHGPGSNQESQTLNKSYNGGIQQRPPSSQRVPMTSLPVDRTASGQHGQPTQSRTMKYVEETGSYQDRYRTPLNVEDRLDSHNRTINNENRSNTAGDEIPENMYKPEKEEIEGWIHREKLAKIENEELQAAGINLAKSRTRSRDVLRVSSRDRLRNDAQIPDNNAREEKRSKVSSPVPLHSGDEEPLEPAEWDLRSPEEIAAEHTLSPAYVTPVLRKSGSKIPVLSPSAHASPMDEKLDREGPTSRKRTMSGSSSNDDGLYYTKARTGSSTWNESSDVSSSVTSRKPSSPTKTRQQSANGMIGTSPGVKAGIPRKASTTTKALPSSQGRPRTRGNDTERPRTAVNPPEGDPPWLADMYKPDPRLPPEEQLIPTLAKKQRQQQWEQSGMIPKTYDRDFEALAVHESGTDPNTQPIELRNITNTDKQDEAEQWPLKPISSNRTTKESPTKSSANNSPAPTGGYSTMPRVSSPPMSAASPNIGTNSRANVASPSPYVNTSKKSPPRIQLDDDDEKAQKKGCGCCVVM